MKGKLLSNEEKERKCTISESVDCIMSLLASNIVLLLSLQVQLNQQIVVLQMWLLWICGSYCDENIHHEEEAWPNFCCSLLLVRFLCPSVYIQEGQGVNNGYLLLGVYARRAPSSTILYVYS
jgi:hypothetical protein